MLLSRQFLACAMIIFLMGCYAAYATTAKPSFGEVKLSAAQIAAENITTTKLQPLPFTPTRQVFVRVLNITPLIALRERLAKAKADATAAEANSTNLIARYNRDLGLFNAHQTVSVQALQDSKAASVAADALVASTTARTDMIRATIIQQYGRELANDMDNLRALQHGDKRLVSVIFPADFKGAAPTDIRLAATNGNMVPSRLVGPGSAVDSLMSGQPFYYVTPAPLPVGFITSAQLPLASTRRALLIPTRAVLWYAGARWAYVELQPGLFQRRQVSARIMAGQYLAGADIQAGNKVVTSGAQLLLSQELLPHAIATNCKDPPECDD